jgi:hypothetical protein
MLTDPSCRAGIALDSSHGQTLARPDLPFPSDISAETADALTEQLGHYAFRLVGRGVIHHGDGFTPNETTQRPQLV